ncbi:DUF2721 domain-containing protein [Duganella aceris]|jgi:hypothetical protein|uniref:DUF2721 domain-containing protein n=1 Tax=Duganella aceris TaxID=2703883 RepID=A0ABX0FRF2_9BURK|nr:DUF2721 domain-containing protein [Duganella aceris]NGZ87043.1 DUF2721 domain-containing protein [Duganella aceris]
MSIQLGDVGHIIQLAIAPVFLLSSVCTKLIVLINRMSRIVDRTRVLEERIEVECKENYLRELAVLDRRYHHISTAISLATACGLFVCSIIALLFISNALDTNLDQYVAGMFVIAVLCFIGSFSFLLKEIFVTSAFKRDQCLRRPHVHR